MNHLELKVRCHVSFNSMIIMITFLLYEGGDDFNFTKKNILIYLHLYLRLNGENFFTEGDKALDKYGKKTGYSGMREKAKRLTYEFFPELSGEANSLKFIKS